MTITYSFSGNGNSTYAIGSLVDWHSSALIADQIQVLLNDVELVDGVDYEINEGAKALELTSPASGSDIITLNRVTPDTFFSTLETAGAASATSTLSNDQQLMNRIQEVEADIVVASANTTIQDDNGNLFGILKPGDNVGFTFNPSDGSLTVSSSGGSDGNGGSGISLNFTDGIGSQGPATSFTIDSATTGFATTVVSDDLQAQINQLNSDLGGYVQASGFNTLFDGRFDTRIADYEVKTISSPNGTLIVTENGAGNFELETAGGQSVSSLQGQAGDLLMDMRVDGADTGVSNRIGLDGCSHDPTTPTFAGVTPAGTATGVEGWSWIHDLGAGSFVSHKPLSGTRDSELIGDKTLTVSGTIAGDSDQLVKLASDDRIKQEAAGYGKDQIMPPWQVQAREGFFELQSGFKSNTDRHGQRPLYLAVLDETDVTSSYNYVYPEDFKHNHDTQFGSDAGPEDQVDRTGYNPRFRAYDDNIMTHPVFYPGIDYSLEKLASPIFGQQTHDIFKGDTAAYYADRGIAEPTPGSGVIRERAPFRLFNVSSSGNGWTSPDLGHGTMDAENASYLHQSTGQPIDDNNFALRLDAANSDDTGTYNRRPNMMYIPANPNGGIVKLEAIVYNVATRARSLLLLFAGLDEANKSIGPKESIIPVAGAQRNATSNDIVEGVGVSGLRRLTYYMDLSDGLPRYLGVGSGSISSNPSGMYVREWKLSRADVSADEIYGNYHDGVNLDTVGADWNFTRGIYDPYVQSVLETYSVNQ